LSSKTIL